MYKPSQISLSITDQETLSAIPVLPYTNNKRGLNETSRSRFQVLDVPELPTLPQPAVVDQHKQHNTVLEWGIVALILAVAFSVRLYAALNVGLEVDEPIYRNAVALTLQYGYPTIRPAYLHPVIPFLYHPPFFLFLLAGWFKLWGSTSYITGRMCSVTVSLVMLLLLYVSARQICGRKVALIVLALVGSDAWVIFTNQAIYLENTLMILVILAIWVYWRATFTSPSARVHYLGWYASAGLLVGCVIIYKQIGGFIALVICLNFLLQRKHLLGHVVLGALVLLIVAGYGLAMHRAFGALYDAASLDQLHRTLGQKAAPGLNASASTALQTIWSRYWMFLSTIVVLVSGSTITLIRYLQAIVRRLAVAQPVIVSWALGGVLFALAISLKDPHYMILWIVPLYLVLALEFSGAHHNRRSLLGPVTSGVWTKRRTLTGGQVIVNFKSRLHAPSHRAQAFALFVCILLLAGNIFGFQVRFLHTHEDSLQEADAYINKTLPPSAVVLTQNYIGVDLVPQFLDITLVTTPPQILRRGVNYMALYWSDSEPIPPSLGPLNRYCLPMKEFSGFKDHVEICKIDPISLAAVANPPMKHSKKVP